MFLFRINFEATMRYLVGFLESGGINLSKNLYRRRTAQLRENTYRPVGFKIVAAVKIHILVLWFMTSCSLIVGYKRFGGT
jgi:hypothetical protein